MLHHCYKARTQQARASAPPPRKVARLLREEVVELGGIEPPTLRFEEETEPEESP